jgi:ketopantoate reductase
MAGSFDIEMSRQRKIDHFVAYLRRYAQAHGVTITSYEANEGKLH